MLFRVCLLALSLSACTRLGLLARTEPETRDLSRVIIRGTVAGDWEDGMPIVVYEPMDHTGPLPAIVFLPARSAPEWQYESTGRMLAERGFVVAVRGWYGFFRTDPELAADARRIFHWLVDQGLADPRRMGLAGHSMGGKSSILAALAEPGVRAVVAIDPDENGYTHVARGPIERLRPPLLVIGMEVATKAFRLCATPNGNYRSFFPHAPLGTVELTVLGADHVQMMDQPDMLGMGICRVGTADSRFVRTITQNAVVRFFQRHLLELPVDLPHGPGIAERIKSAPTVANN